MRSGIIWWGYRISLEPCALCFLNAQLTCLSLSLQERWPRPQKVGKIDAFCPPTEDRPGTMVQVKNQERMRGHKIAKPLDIGSVGCSHRKSLFSWFVQDPTPLGTNHSAIPEPTDLASHPGVGDRWRNSAHPTFTNRVLNISLSTYRIQVFISSCHRS